MNAEATGIRARIAVLDKTIEERQFDYDVATAEHWRALYQNELFEAMRARDELTARLALIEKKKNG